MSPAQERILERIADALERLAERDSDTPSGLGYAGRALDVEEAAAELGEHPSTMRRRIAALPESKRPRWTGSARRRRYYWRDLDDLHAWLASLNEAPKARRGRPLRVVKGEALTSMDQF